MVEGFRRVAGDEVAQIAGRSYAGEEVAEEEWARVYAAFGPQLPDQEREVHTPKNLELNSYGMELIRQLDIVGQLSRVGSPTLVRSASSTRHLSRRRRRDRWCPACRHRPAQDHRRRRPLHVEGRPGPLLAHDYRVHQRHNRT
jgi:hypothetical protein